MNFNRYENISSNDLQIFLVNLTASKFSFQIYSLLRLMINTHRLNCSVYHLNFKMNIFFFEETIQLNNHINHAYDWNIENCQVLSPVYDKIHIRILY